MNIRKAKPEDAPAIAEVHVRSWQQTYVGQIPDEYLAGLDRDLPRRTEVWRRFTEDARSEKGLYLLFVAEEAEKIVGFLGFAPCRDEDIDPATTGELVVYLLQPFWGRGIGKALHDAAIAELRARDATLATLWVLGTNVRARRWYERQGWIPDGATKADERGTFTLTELRYRLPLDNM